MIPHGYCHCGCGQKTELAPESRARLGWVRGEPKPYIRFHRNIRNDFPEYRVDESGCWVTNGPFNTSGYVQVMRRHRNIVVHRWSYEKHVGPIPEGLQLDHLCRNRGCINPAHLEPVTQAENVRRGLNAKLTPADVAFIRRCDTPAKELALRFGVSAASINRARRGTTWAPDKPQPAQLSLEAA